MGSGLYPGGYGPPMTARTTPAKPLRRAISRNALLAFVDVRAVPVHGRHVPRSETEQLRAIGPP